MMVVHLLPEMLVLMVPTLLQYDYFVVVPFLWLLVLYHSASPEQVTWPQWRQAFLSSQVWSHLEREVVSKLR